jgi:hypothetical protein
MLAYDYPLLDVFVTIVALGLLVVWVFLLFCVFADLFRDHEQSGAGKVLWIVVLLVLPYIGVIAYIYRHGDGMSLRSREVQVRRAQLIRY